MAKRERTESLRTFTYLNAAFRCRRFKGATRLVLLSLADRANASGVCFSSYEDLMHRAGCSRPSVAHALEELKAVMVDGNPLLTVERRFMKSSYYTLHYPALRSLAYEQDSDHVEECELCTRRIAKANDDSSEAELGSDADDDFSGSYMTGDSSAAELTKVQKLNPAKFSGLTDASSAAEPTAVKLAERKPTVLTPQVDPPNINAPAFNLTTEDQPSALNQDQNQNQSQSQNPTQLAAPAVTYQPPAPVERLKCPHGRFVGERCLPCPRTMATRLPACPHGNFEKECFNCRLD